MNHQLFVARILIRLDIFILLIIICRKEPCKSLVVPKRWSPEYKFSQIHNNSKKVFHAAFESNILICYSTWYLILLIILCRNETQHVTIIQNAKKYKVIG